MKLEKFTATPAEHGRVQIFFTESITEDDYDIRLFVEYFKKNKRTRLFYSLKPKVRLDGLICDERDWTKFLVKIQRKELAVGFYEVIRDISFKSVEEVIKCLKMMQDAEKTIAEKELKK